MTPNEVILYNYNQCLAQSSLEKQMEINSDPQPDIMQSVEILEHSVQNRMFSSYPPLREKGTRQRKQKDLKSQKEWRTERQQGPLNQHDHSSYELKETEEKCTGLHGFAPAGGPRVEDEVYTLPQKLSRTENHSQMKIRFPPREFHWENKLLYRVDCMPSSRWATENELSGILGSILSQNGISGLFLVFVFNLIYIFSFLLLQL